MERLQHNLGFTLNDDFKNAAVHYSGATNCGCAQHCFKCRRLRQVFDFVTLLVAGLRGSACDKTLPSCERVRMPLIEVENLLYINIDEAILLRNMRPPQPSEMSFTPVQQV